MKGSYFAGKEGCGMASRIHSQTRRLDSNEMYTFFKEGIEEAHRIASSAHTGHQIIGKAALFLQHLLLCFLADDRLKISDHHGIGMRSDHRADEIVSILDMRDPIPDGLVDGILQCLA